VVVSLRPTDPDAYPLRRLRANRRTEQARDERTNEPNPCGAHGLHLPFVVPTAGLPVLSRSEQAGFVRRPGYHGCFGPWWRTTLGGAALRNPREGRACAGGGAPPVFLPFPSRTLRRFPLCPRPSLVGCFTPATARFEHPPQPFEKGRDRRGSCAQGKPPPD